jgi:Ca2+-transporting ATPase
MDNLMDNSSSFWQKSELETLTYFQVDLSTGLHDDEIIFRQKKFGLNILTEKKPTSKLSIFIRQFKSIIVFLLISAATVSFVLGQWIEGFSIVFVLLINALLGFMTEYKAIRSMEALKLMGRTTTNIIRNGKFISIDAEQLVPGDIVVLEAGDMITADIRIINSSKLAADESVLTGESVPVEKSKGLIKSDVILAEKTNMLFKGTFLTRGSAKGVVIATGMQTELGKIAKITQEAVEEITPLEERLNKLGQQLVWISLFIGIFVAVSGIMSGKTIMLMFTTAVALAVSTIPEGLPIVATMALAKGMWRMASKNALVNKLSAVETLGATSIIFSDKTGTLTENKMVVRSYYLDDGYFEINDLDRDISPSLEKCLEIGILCNNAFIDPDSPNTSIGDPMEVALLNVGHKLTRLSKEGYLKKYPELREEAFDPDGCMMATYHDYQNQILVAVKGAPESLMKSCSFIYKDGNPLNLDHNMKELWLTRNQEMANDGLRVLALAYKFVHDKEKKPYEELIFTGLVGIADPARTGIKEAIKKCRSAGIRIIMVTGDQAGTAKKIARDINLVTDGHLDIIKGDELGDRALWSDQLKNKLNSIAIFSRVNPQQKLDLIQYYQDQSHVVAMTGDGVNDAPALKKADIGIAMGKRGTQVAREAADMVLKDDSFETIVLAIQQGRIIFSNIRRFVVYLLSCNISEVLIVSIAAIVNAPLPILPLQILFLNLVTDIFPALALGMGEGDSSYLERPPREVNESVISRERWWFIGSHGLIITVSVLMVFFLTLKGFYGNTGSAVTVAFLTLGFAQLFHVFNMRQTKSNFIFNEITRNPYVWGAIVVCTILLLGAVYIPGLSKILSLIKPSSEEWFLIIGFSLIPLLIGQMTLAINKNRN